MPGGSIVIIDLTGEAARASVFTPHGVAPVAQFDFPARAAVRMGAGAPEIICGPAALEVVEDADTLVFEDLFKGFAQIRDADVQASLARGLWEALEHELVERGALTVTGRALGYIIPPRSYTHELIETIRAACADTQRLRLAGFCHETAALATGLLRSEEFARACDEADITAPSVVCLLVTRDDALVEVACFDYLSDEGGRARVRVQDHFRAPLAALTERLKACDWLGSFSAIVSLEGARLAPRERVRLDEVIDAIALGVPLGRVESAGPEELKTQGAAFVARTAVGAKTDVRDAGDAGDEYTIEAAYHLGVRVNQSSLHPVLTRDEYADATSYPHVGQQAFALHGQPGNELHVSLYCGHSEAVSEGTFLGSVILDRRHIAALDGRGASALAVVKLDSPAVGDFALILQPGGEVAGQFNFTLPALVA